MLEVAVHDVPLVKIAECQHNLSDSSRSCGHEPSQTILLQGLSSSKEIEHEDLEYEHLHDRREDPEEDFQLRRREALAARTLAGHTRENRIKQRSRVQK